MVNRFIMYFLGICLFGMACKDANQKHVEDNRKEDYVISETNHPEFVSNMEVAHQKSELLKHGIVCLNLDMAFGNRNTKMKIFTTPNSSAIRVDKKDGASTVMINGEIYTDADTSRWSSERFGVFTYQYFFMAPYKFSDEGTIWEKMLSTEIEGKKLNRAELRFESGTGDAPDDWYIVHSDPATNRVEYIAYIVTGGGTSLEEAEKNAHAIRYSDYINVDGVPMASKWEFFNYSKEEGLGAKIGDGMIRNIEFMDLVDQFDIIHDGTYRKIID